MIGHGRQLHIPHIVCSRRCAQVDRVGPLRDGNLYRFVRSAAGSGDPGAFDEAVIPVVVVSPIRSVR